MFYNTGKRNRSKIRAESPMTWVAAPGLTALDVCKYWDTISLLMIMSFSLKGCCFSSFRFISN